MHDRHRSHKHVISTARTGESKPRASGARGRYRVAELSGAPAKILGWRTSFVGAAPGVDLAG